jgi:hypothetical protein
LPEQQSELAREIIRGDVLVCHRAEFPALSIVKLRMEIERSLRDVTKQLGMASKRPTSIGSVLRELQHRGLAPPSTARFLESLKIMNEAVHGYDLDAAATAQAVSIGNDFLAELENLRQS